MILLGENKSIPVPRTILWNLLLSWKVKPIKINSRSVKTMIKGLSIGKKHSLLALSTIKRVSSSSLNQKSSLSEDPALEFL
jgi:hypothetical protein